MKNTKGHLGAIPDKPYARASIIAAKVTPEMRRKLRALAAEKDATVSAVIIAAVEGYLAQHMQGVAA